MISTVIFDVDGVLRRWSPAVVSDAERDYGLPPGSLGETAFDDPWLTQAVTGIVSDSEWRNDIAARLAQRVGVPPEQAAAAVAQWSASHGTIDPDVLELMRRQRRMRTVALLSNATDRLESDLAHLNVALDVDAIYNSSRMGRAKPDPEIFSMVCGDLGVPPRHCAFVDDTATHARAAASSGLRAHQFTSLLDLKSFLRDLP